MIKLEAELANAKGCQNLLKKMESKSSTVLARAMNRAVTTAKASILNNKTGIPNKYRIIRKVAKDAVSEKKTDAATLKASVTIKGRTRSLVDFTVSPMTSVSYKNGKPTPKVYKSAVLKGKGLVSLNKTDTKPFVAVTKKGFTGLFSRKGKNDLIEKEIIRIRDTEKGKKEYRGTRKVEKLQMHFAPSIPQMANNEEIIGATLQETEDTINKRLEAEYRMLLGRNKK